MWRRVAPGMTMEHAVVSLEAPGTDWPKLVRFVERSGQPIWLEADGEIRGVLLPAGEARRLMGGCAGHGGAPAEADDAGTRTTTPQEESCVSDDSLAASSSQIQLSGKEP